MEPSEQYLAEALEAYNERKFLKAVQLATKALKHGCTDITAYQLNALSLFYVGAYEKSIPDFSSYLNMGGTDDAMLLQRSTAYALTNRHANAIEDVNKYIAAHPEESIGYQHRGYTFLCMNKHDEAIADLSKAIQLGNEEAKTFFQRGAAYFNTKRFEEANADLSRAAKEMTEDHETFYLRGLTFYFRKDYAQCIQDMSRVIYLDENHLYARFYRLCAYRDAGRMTDAQYDADQLVKTHNSPFTFFKNEISLPLVSMKVRTAAFDFELDTSPLGEPEQIERAQWNATHSNNEPRPLVDVNIVLTLPQGGIDGFKGFIRESKFPVL